MAQWVSSAILHFSFDSTVRSSYYERPDLNSTLSEVPRPLMTERNRKPFQTYSRTSRSIDSIYSASSGTTTIRPNSIGTVEIVNPSPLYSQYNDRRLERARSVDGSLQLNPTYGQKERVIAVPSQPVERRFSENAIGSPIIARENMNSQYSPAIHKNSYTDSPGERRFSITYEPDARKAVRERTDSLTSRTSDESATVVRATPIRHQNSVPIVSTGNTLLFS
ncbi:unnamed protein product [Echinostoma caproni]|uniref:Uncharacterized protein n=1 Tax=Echinostoma caproni TaxID=27848 RepID=A0A183AMZ0_9TREM|nr:unnamed protein product [Echinostoma caproni]